VPQANIRLKPSVTRMPRVKEEIPIEIKKRGIKGIGLKVWANFASLVQN